MDNNFENEMQTEEVSSEFNFDAEGSTQESEPIALYEGDAEKEAPQNDNKKAPIVVIAVCVAVALIIIGAVIWRSCNDGGKMAANGISASDVSQSDAALIDVTPTDLVSDTDKSAQTEAPAYAMPNGDSYTGEWENGLFAGEGTYGWANGASYEGGWKNGRFNGEGKYTAADGSTYEGEWKDGVRSGYGVYTWASGTRYEGNWENDKFNGEGTLYRADGTVIEGVWKDGVPA